MVDSEADVERAMTEQEALAGLVLPADFDARLAAGERPPLKLMLNGAQERRFNARRLVIDLVISQSGRPLPVDLAEATVNPPQAGGESAPTPASALQGLSIQGWFLVTWSVMSIAMVGMYMVPTLLVEEKERKTLDAMMVAPVSYVDLIAGKALVGLVYAVLSAGLIFLLNAPEEVHSVGGLILIPLALALWLLVTRVVERPLRDMTDGLRELAEGRADDLKPLPVHGEDEVGQAIGAFNTVVGKVRTLLDEQRLMQVVFDNSLEGIGVTDAKVRFRMVNQAFTETTGYTFAEVEGKTPQILK